jgi:hypothetical protein
MHEAKGYALVVAYGEWVAACAAAQASSCNRKPVEIARMGKGAKRVEEDAGGNRKVICRQG